MNIRVCFAKYDRLRFLGHLDVMRYFQHAIARSGMPIAYSAGFHPHMIMSFAQPLALSMTSDGEYFDCELAADQVDAADLRERLQNAMCDGFFIRTVSVLPEREPNTRKQTCMSQIAGAMYLCEPLPVCEQALADALKQFAAKESYCIEKKAKNGTRSVDVRAGIHAIGIVDDPDGAVKYLCDDRCFDTPGSLSGGWGQERSEHALHRDGAVRFLFAVDAGSENNISAELVAAALRQLAEEELPERCVTSHRMELYRNKEGHMISLSET
ncbi:MAG: DUF2344 domain-containing protein [Lachnospiraceae bacterium]|nr:DUF2344 domain-containing protein [Lachnospiraceae bacterium]